MSIRLTSWFAGIAACLVLSMGANLLAAPPMGVGALTARQYIKDKVVDALADGNISPSEQSDILTKAETILQPQEMEGLQRTLNRLQAQTNPGWIEEAAPLPPQSSRRYTDRYAWREPRTSQVFHPMPYSGPPMGPRPLLGSRLGRLGQRLPYIERPAWNGSQGRQLVAGLPRLNEIYPGHPTLLSSRNPGNYNGIHPSRPTLLSSRNPGNYSEIYPSRPTLFSSRNPRDYIVERTRPAPAPMPQVRQAGRPPKRFSMHGAPQSLPNTRKIYSAEELPAVETPVALAPFPDEYLYPSSPARSTAERASYRSKPDYRTSRTAYLESLRNR